MVEMGEMNMFKTKHESSLGEDNAMNILTDACRFLMAACQLLFT